MKKTRDWCRRAYLSAEAGEGRLVLGVDVGGSTATRATAATTTTVTTSLTTTAATSAARATTASTASGALGLNEARVEVNGLLDLALTLALLLASRARDEVLVLLVDDNGGLPLLVELAALVGATDIEVRSNGELLLSLLGEVVGVRDALILGLGVFASTVLSKGILLLGLSNGLTGLLVLQFGVTLGGTPALGGLLVGSTIGNCVSQGDINCLTAQ